MKKDPLDEIFSEKIKFIKILIIVIACGNWRYFDNSANSGHLDLSAYKHFLFFIFINILKWMF